MKVIQSSPGFFNCFNVLGFHNRRAKAIWCTEGLNEFCIMDHAMLMWGLLVLFAYTSVDKDFSALVIEGKKLLKPLNSHGVAAPSQLWVVLTGAQHLHVR